MAGEHVVYSPGRTDSRLEASVFPDAGLEVITFSRAQVNRLHHLVRKMPAASPEAADGSVTGASETEEGVSQPNDEAELASASRLSTGGSPIADNAVGIREANGETTELVAEDGAKDEGAADAAEEPPADKFNMVSLQSVTADSGEAPASDCEAEGEVSQPELPASQQPFLLQMHAGARPDGMVRHQSSGTAGCCCFEKRHDGLIQRDVLYSRSDNVAALITLQIVIHTKI